MRAEIGLPPPERRIGLAAHDFAEAIAAPRVIVTRAEKRDGAPTVDSRWLQRLSVSLGEDAVLSLRPAAITTSRSPATSTVRSAAPNRSSGPRRGRRLQRPRSLSITEIETLIRDPYAIYAKHILGWSRSTRSAWRRTMRCAAP